MSRTLTIQDIDVSGRRVFVRVDFNVPLDGDKITDDSRIVAAIPTIRHLLERGAKVILASHLGRPKGQVKPEFSLRPVAAHLASKLGQPVSFLPDCIGPEVEAAVSAMSAGTVVLLENVRFHAGEEKNDPKLSAAMARLADVYVNDAFGAAHRAHASTAGITEHVGTKVAGFLMEGELAFLGEKTSRPDRPFVVILGGAKVSDKISVIDALLDKADTILIGGAMAYTFALAQGGKVGQSLSEPDKVEVARAALEKAAAKGVKFLLPVDSQVTQSIDFAGKAIGPAMEVEGDIPEGWSGVDIGARTISLFREEIAKARTILWNGPMGVFEIKACSRGTFAVAEAIAANPAACSIIGGGDSVKAVKRSGHADKVTFMSTGGGASLEFLEGKILPGVVSLDHA